jgi:hypothetical protein
LAPSKTRQSMTIRRISGGSFSNLLRKYFRAWAISSVKNKTFTQDPMSMGPNAPSKCGIELFVRGKYNSREGEGTVTRRREQNERAQGSYM